MMSNPVENELSGHRQEEMHKLIQQRMAQEERARQDELIKEEVRRLAYLESLNLDEIEDEHLRIAAHSVMQTKSASSQEKCQKIQCLLMASRIKSLHQKVELLSEEDRQAISQYSLDNLSRILAKGQNLQADDLAKGEDAVRVIGEAIEKIGERKIAASLATKADYDRLSPDKKTAHFAANLARETQKKRNEILNKTRERLGVA